MAANSSRSSQIPIIIFCADSAAQQIFSLRDSGRRYAPVRARMPEVLAKRVDYAKRAMTPSGSLFAGSDLQQPI
jgi:hypothetical protein